PRPQRQPPSDPVARAPRPCSHSTLNIQHSTSNQEARPRREHLLLIAILLLAAGLRIYHLNANSFWFDEFASAALACGHGYLHYALPENVVIESPPKLFDLKAAAPIHEVWFSEPLMHLPPLYMMVTRVWGEMFGLGQGSLRA